MKTPEDESAASADELSEPPRLLPPRFASVVAHELRNPLSAVKIALQTVGRSGQLPDKDATRLRIALREVGTIERVLDLVVDWARPPALSIQPLPVDRLVQQTLEFLAPVAEEHRARVDVTRADVLPLVLGDPEHLPRALAEVIRNALEASPAGAPVELQVRADGDRLVFRIEDRGRPLTDEARQLAFEPFWSGRARGVGLGLSTARAIVARLGGTLTLDRAAGENGNVAVLELPAARGAT